MERFLFHFSVIPGIKWEQRAQAWKPWNKQQPKTCSSCHCSTTNYWLGVHCCIYFSIYLSNLDPEPPFYTFIIYILLTKSYHLLTVLRLCKLPPLSSFSQDSSPWVLQLATVTFPRPFASQPGNDTEQGPSYSYFLLLSPTPTCAGLEG